MVHFPCGAGEERATGASVGRGFTVFDRRTAFCSGEAAGFRCLLLTSGAAACGMDTSHGGAVVEKALAGYDGRTMASLAEKSVFEDVAAIRINGSLWGAFLGAAFFAVSILWETLMQ